MKTRTAVLLRWLLALCCLESSGQIHGWLHHQDGPVSRSDELHDGECSHFPEHDEHREGCTLCVVGRTDLGAPALAAGTQLVELSPSLPVDVAVDRRPAAAPHGALGARAPPRLG